MDLFAYLDAGSGSVILQAILAGVAGAAVATKMYWQRVKSFFKRSKDGQDDDTAVPAVVEARGAED